MLPGRAYTPATFVWILRRRLWLLVSLLVLFTGTAVWLAATLPDIYRAQTTIIVLPQRVSEAYVRSVLAETLEQRLIAVGPQILNAAQLERIITELDLYPEIRKQATMEQVVETMRRSITVEVVRGDLFRVGYYGYWPEKVMQVTQRLGALFVNENFKNREQMAADTSEFLESQLEDARQRLIEQERQLQEYRTRNAAHLPSQVAANLQVLDSTQQQLRTLQEALVRDRERRLELEQAMLLEEQRNAPTPDAAPTTAANDEGDAGASDAARSDSDAPAAGGEVDLSFGPAGTPDSVRLQRARLYLENLQLRLTEAHPDIQRAKRIIAQLEKTAVAQTARGVEPAQIARTARVTAAAGRLAVLDREIAQKVAEESRLKSAMGDYQGRIEQSPAHEARLIELTRDYETVQGTYRTLLAKKEESGIAASLERQQAGQQFRVLEPARVPASPTSPNRPRIVLFGAGGALALGLALVVLLELRDQSFRTASEVIQVLALPVLAMVPPISTRFEQRRFYRRVAVCAAVVVVIGLVGGLFAFRGRF